MKEKPRIGVYICHCGGNISDTVDVEHVKKAMAEIEQVKVVDTFEYLCSNPGQEMIRKGIKEHELNRVVVASCSLRMHLETFRQACMHLSYSNGKIVRTKWRNQAKAKG